MKFAGTERITVELAGTFEPQLALPDGLAFDLVDGRARVSLFAFHVDDLRIGGVPFVRSSYAEVLWRIAVVHAGEPAWWVAACDLAARVPAIAARRFVRYPVRMVPVEVGETRIATGGLEFALETGSDPVSVEQRTLLTGTLWRVPWGDDARGAHRAQVRNLTDRAGRETLGADVTWSTTAIVRRGREHRCGSAIAV